jgi:cytochrome c-type protein NapB
MNSIRITTALLILIAVSGGTLLAVQSPGIADRELSLSKTSVFEVTAPAADEPNDSDPGDRPVTPADFPEQPPRVSHGVGDFLPITFDDNQCIDCHAVEEKEEGEPTPIPASHYTDLRNAPEEVGDEVVGARYVCTACHAVPGDDAPLVENGFVPDGTSADE